MDDNNGKVLLYKTWSLDGRTWSMWYFASITKGPRGKLTDRIIWTDNLGEAQALDHATAWDYAKTLTTNYTANGGEACAIGVMPYNGPATAAGKR